MRGTVSPLQRGPFSLTIPDTVGPLTIPGGASGSSLSDDLLPWLVNVDVFMTAISAVNWSTITVVVNAVYNGYLLSSGAQNDEVSFDVVLATGTWTFELIYPKGSNAGIVTVLLDSTSLGTIDAYVAGTSYDNRSQITGIAVSTTAKYRLTLRMATKNASSTGYFGGIQHLQFKRTA